MVYKPFSWTLSPPSTKSPRALDLLKEVVLKMEQKAFQVWGSSFDLGNKEFLSDIDFKNGTHKIGNPADPARSFYFVAEFPHMLKLFRNHMFDKGFWFPKNLW